MYTSARITFLCWLSKVSDPGKCRWVLVILYGSGKLQGLLLGIKCLD